ncbi:hypothetical protein [Chelativorans intermedius]|uniref:Uncharacterized protein n=1 Tax=Chelativorans intermedius TaxID=515947 RepID=A0ABV6D9T4_9HYPH|nr:hypothetical protein [Chelativorans intermedius]MCT8999121.1 hypothetical protein [Chelativorans intermedius]
MASILQGEIAAEIVAALEAERVPYALTLVRQETGGDPWDPIIVDVPYDCRGWRDDYSLDERDGTLIQQDDVRVFIIASSLAIEPTTADTISLAGVSHSIVSVKRDPAGALWEVQARR